MGATGSIGGIMTFSSWKGRPFVRRLVIPANPDTGPQRAVRAFFSWGSKEWAQLTALQKATWVAPAAPTNVLPFNAFMKQGQNNAKQDLGFQIEYPNVAVAAPLVPTLPSATGGVGQATIVWTDPVGAQHFGVIVYADSTGAVVPSPQNIIGVADIGEQQIIIPRLTPGTWHFALKSFATDADLSAATADFTAVVT